MRVILIFFCIGVAYGCRNEPRLEHYSNGQVKQKIEIDSEGLQHGISRFYREDGTLEYIGEYNKGQRTGKHQEYYASGKLKKETVYGIVDGSEKWLEEKLYGEDDLIELYHKQVDGEFYYSILNGEDIIVGDTVRILVRLTNPNYLNSIAVVGDIDQNLRSIDKSQNKTFVGNANHEVIIDYNVLEGTNIVRGMFRDFKFEPYPDIDTLGYTVAEDSYFEYQFTVKEKKII